MFVWGKADDGQLGLGGIEDTFIPVARSWDIIFVIYRTWKNLDFGLDCGLVFD